MTRRFFFGMFGGADTRVAQNQARPERDWVNEGIPVVTVGGKIRTAMLGTGLYLNTATDPPRLELYYTRNPWHLVEGKPLVFNANLSAWELEGGGVSFADPLWVFNDGVKLSEGEDYRRTMPWRFYLESHVAVGTLTVDYIVRVL